MEPELPSNRHLDVSQDVQQPVVQQLGVQRPSVQRPTLTVSQFSVPSRFISQSPFGGQFKAHLRSRSMTQTTSMQRICSALNARLRALSLSSSSLALAKPNLETDRRLQYVLRSIYENKKQNLIDISMTYSPYLDPQVVFGHLERHLPLHIAAYYGRPEIIECLVCDFNLPVNIRDKNLFTPLHQACRSIQPQSTHVLINMGADIHARSRLHLTSLHICAMFDSVACAQELISRDHRGTLLYYGDSNGRTAFHLAILHKSINMINFLLECTDLTFQDNSGFRPIHLAAICDFDLLIEILAANGAILSCRNKAFMTPLLCAISNFSNRSFYTLLDLGVNPSISDKNGNIAIHYATYYGNMEVFEELYEMKRIEINHSNFLRQFPIHIASYSPYCVGDCFMKILNCSPFLDIDDAHMWKPLHYAAQVGDDFKVRLLLRKGANINSLNDMYENPLHVAIRAKKTRIVRTLLEKGASVNRRNYMGESCLHLAIRAGMPWLCGELIDAKAPVHELDHNGRSPMFLAAIKGDFDSFYLLLKAITKSRPYLDEDLLYPVCDNFNRNILLLAAASPKCHLDFVLLFLEILLDRVSIDYNRQISELVGPEPWFRFKRRVRQVVDIHAVDLNHMNVLHLIMNRKPFHDYHNLLMIAHYSKELGIKIAYQDDYGNMAIHYAIKSGHAKVIPELFKSNWLDKPTKYSDYFPATRCLLSWAANYGQTECLKVLLSLNIREGIDLALNHSVRQNHTECVAILTPLVSQQALMFAAERAVRRCNLSSLKIIMQTLPVQQCMSEWLFSISKCSFGNSMETFLYITNELNVSANVYDSINRNLLFYSVLSGNIRIAKVLINQHRLPFSSDQNKRNIFHYIARKNLIHIFDSLLPLCLNHHSLRSLAVLVHAHDCDGHSPIEICEFYNFKDLYLRMGRLCARVKKTPSF